MEKIKKPGWANQILLLVIIGFGCVNITGCATCNGRCIFWNFAISVKHGPNANAQAPMECDQLCDLTARLSRDTTPGQAPSTFYFAGEYFHYDVTVGAAASFKSSKDEYSYGESKHTPGVGPFISIGTAIPLTAKWGVAGEIGFKQSVASEKTEYNEPGGGGGNTEYKQTYKYNYITGGLMAEYWMAPGLAIAAGPELNYLVSANVKTTGSPDKEDIKKTSTSVGLDAKLGLKYEIPRSNNRRSKWGLQLIYDHRLSRLNKKEDAGMSVPAYRMRSLQLGLSCFL